MHRFRTLGKIELTSDDGTAVHSLLSQPKRVALLGYLAWASPEGCSREELVELFWPGLEEDNARHALSQAVYYLRRSLGKHAVVSGAGDEVRLSVAHVACDLREFRAALEDDEPESAGDLVAGDFLEGFALADLSTFDRWLEDARSRIRADARDAALAASQRAEERGDPRAACRWAGRAFELAPYEERPLRRLLGCLQASGDRGRALATYQAFRHRLQEDLEVEPSAATKELIEEIRAAGNPEDPAPPARATFAGPAGRRGEQGDPRRTRADQEPGLPSSPMQPEGGPTIRTPVAAGSTWKLAGRFPPLSVGPASLVAWSLALIFGLSLAWFGRPDAGTDAAPPAAEDQRIAVLPFDFHGTEQYAYLGSGIAELLNIGLSELTSLRTVDPRAIAAALEASGPPDPSPRAGDRIARRFGAEFYLMGSVMEVGGRLQVIAYFYRRGEDLLATLREHAEDETALFEVVDDVVRGLVALEHLPAGTQLVRTAAVTTHSLPALRAFLQGEGHYRTGQYRQAIEALERAVAIDSSFALAYYRAARSALWTGTGDFDGSRSWLANALRHIDRVPEQEQLLIRALDAFLRGAPSEAESLYRRMLAVQPENVEAWFSLGEVQFHYGPIMGRSPTLARESWERVLDVEPDHRGALFHLALTAASEEKREELTATLSRLSEIDATAPPSVSVEALVAWANEDRASQLGVLERVRHEPARQGHWVVEYLVRYLRHVAGAAEVAQVLLEAAPSPEERFEGHLRLALLDAARGRVEEAGRQLALASEIDPLMALLYRAYLASTPRVPVELRRLVVDPRSGFRQDPPGAPLTEDAAPRLPGPGPGELRAAQGLGGGRGALATYLSALLMMDGERDPTAPEVSESIAQLREAAAGEPARFPLARGLADGLAAEVDLRGAGVEPALERLRLTFESGVDRWYEETRLSPLFVLGRERFQLAELFNHVGEPEQAAQWHRSLVRSSLGEVPLLGPSLLRLGEIHEAMGDPEGAIDHYRRVVELWEDADAEFRPIVAELEARIRHLSESAVAGVL